MVASVLKLYLLELPDPVVSAHVYDIIKTIYTNTATDSSEATRIQVIQNTLGTLRLANIATLDALTTHFSRLIELTSADEAYVAALATNLAPCILRPKHETTLTMNERFAYRLLRDLIAHKDAVFGELKRASSLKMRERAGRRSGSRPRRARPAGGAGSGRRGRGSQSRWRGGAARARVQHDAARGRAGAPPGHHRRGRRRCERGQRGGARRQQEPQPVAEPVGAPVDPPRALAAPLERQRGHAVPRRTQAGGESDGHAQGRGRAGQPGGAGGGLVGAAAESG